MPGVDVHHRERQPARPKGLERQVQHDDRVLATGEEQHWLLELRGHLADDVDGLGLQHPQMTQLVLADGLVEFGGRHDFLFKLVEIARIAIMPRNLRCGRRECQRFGPYFQ